MWLSGRGLPIRAVWRAIPYRRSWVRNEATCPNFPRGSARGLGIKSTLSNSEVSDLSPKDCDDPPSARWTPLGLSWSLLDVICMVVGQELLEARHYTCLA